jgi:hypothetical protein
VIPRGEPIRKWIEAGGWDLREGSRYEQASAETCSQGEPPLIFIIKSLCVLRIRARGDKPMSSSGKLKSGADTSGLLRVKHNNENAAMA